MIINVRGTHGSGKSTLVRQIIDSYPKVTEIKTAIRRRPWGYVLGGPGLQEVYIPGHYETPCGGCDTISAINDIYNRIRLHAEFGRHVLFEGIVAQHSTKGLMGLRDLDPIVIVLTTPVEQCIEDVQRRRLERGRLVMTDTGNITKEFRNAIFAADKLQQQGIKVEFMDRASAKASILEAFGWTS